MTITFETTKNTKLKHIKMLKFLLERYIEPTPIFYEYKTRNIIVKFDNKRFDIVSLTSSISFILKILRLGDNQLQPIGFDTN
jgi:hypothetical protein